ncbi:hypothetical protein D3C80_1755260 [compost metagenome]
MQYLLILTRQEQAHIVHLLTIFVFTHQPGDTRPQATANLVLQTRARAVAVYAVLALTYREQFLQQRQCLTHGIGIWEWTEVFPLGMFGTTMHGQPRVTVRTEEDQRIRFIVSQKNIISRLV